MYKRLVVLMVNTFTVVLWPNVILFLPHNDHECSMNSLIKSND